MNVKQIITVGVAGMALCALALDNVEVTEVKARQRYPWNGKVDIDFTLDSKSTEPYQMRVEVYDNVGRTNLPVKSVCTENVSVEANPCMVRTDTTRIVWDAAKDLPNGFKCTNVLVSCRDDRLGNVAKRYMIIDISTGASSSTYQITYTNCPPSGGWSDEYKKHKIVLRRIPEGAFPMGSPITEPFRGDNEGLHNVTLSKSYYIGVFEVTRAQWFMVMGAGVSDVLTPEYAYFGEIRGYGEITNSTHRVTSSECNVEHESFVGRLRARTRNVKIDLPTEAQWERACRSGSYRSINIGMNCEQEFVSLCARNAGNCNDGRADVSLTRETKVGCYVPNAFGLYDMLGNAIEWCADEYSSSPGNLDLVDPLGPTNSLVKVNARISGNYDLTLDHVVRGGGYYYSFEWDGYKGSNSPVAKETYWDYRCCRSAMRASLTTGLHYSATSKTYTRKEPYDSYAKYGMAAFRLCVQDSH